MPIQECQSGNKRGYKWGEKGKCYTYTQDDFQSRLTARRKALAQGIASGDIEIKKIYGPESLLEDDPTIEELFLECSRFLLCEKAENTYYIG